MNKPTVAIIGYGKFTKLMIEHLSPHADIVVVSRRPNIEHGKLHFTDADLPTALKQNVIIPSIPSQFFEEFFGKHKDAINPDALVIDVCSVKVKPVDTMLRLLPPSCQILATHPLFGPASTPGSLSGQKIVVWPVRIPKERYAKIKRFLTDVLKLDVIEKTPKEHDKMMAYAQGLSHYIGRVMQNMRIPESDITTNAYNDLLDMKRIQGNDSWELFESIMFDNPYAPEVHRRFKRAMEKLDKRLGADDLLH